MNMKSSSCPRNMNVWLIWLLFAGAQSQYLRTGQEGTGGKDIPHRPTGNLPNCPLHCSCYESSCGKEVDCSGLKLEEIPRGLDPTTECLDLSMNNISKITQESLSPLKDLKKLCLSGNRLTELPPNVLNGLRKIETLMLQDNLLMSVPANTISKMPSLTDLNLGANFIRTISPNAFAKLDNLAYLWLDDNVLEEIPNRALSKAPNIKALNLVMNKIEVMKNGDLKNLANMNVLLLKHNKISKIENNAFEGATSIQIVDLSSNNLTFVPPAIKNIHTLDQLFLNNNSIEEIPDVAFAGNPLLRELTLEDNPLRSVGRIAFSGLQHLESLSIQDAEDQEHFPDFSGCSRLTKLSFVGGKISNIPSNLCSHLPSLESLTLSRNSLRNIFGLSQCHNLTYLDASGNELTNLTYEETKDLSKLKTLDLSSNRIQRLGADAFEGMSLEKLNLAYNSFNSLPARGLGNLKKLNVSGVRTLLYLPPKVLLQSLTDLVAFYPYHCCQLAKSSWQTADNYFARQDVIAQGGVNQSPHRKSPYFDATLTPIQCSPDPGPLTPCDDLLPSTPLRVFSWLFMVVSFLLNGLVLVSCSLRYCVRRRTRLSTGMPSDEQMLRRADTDSPYPGNPESRIISGSEVVDTHYCLNLSRGSGNLASDGDCFDLALCHLAFADVIVTTYTAVILTYDHSTSGNFAEYGAWWQQSAPCHSAGFLLTLGTQLAFITIAIMVVERYLANVHPLQPERHMKKSVLAMTLTAAWVISIATATVTLFGGGQDHFSPAALPDLLPAQNGAACLPWTTEFSYVAVLVGLHVVMCLLVVALGIMMLLSTPKQAWMSTRKTCRRQVALAIAFNLSMILPLAVLALYVSGVVSFSGALPESSGGYYTFLSQGEGKIVLDMEQVLAFVLYAIPLRPLLNPILYIAFNGRLRRDLTYLARKIVIGESKPTHLIFPPSAEVLETMYASSLNVPHEVTNQYSMFNQPVGDSAMLQQNGYENTGIAASSSVSYRTSVSVPHIVRSSSHNGESTRSSERRRRRRSRSRRTAERRTTDTDPTTESDVITFHRAEGAVHYNKELNERRKKKLSVREGGVNARNEFQRLIFPRVPMTSSSSHGSNSTIYPILPVSRSAIMSSRGNRSACTSVTTQSTAYTGVGSSISSLDSPTTAREQQPSERVLQQQQNHYDISALSNFRDPNAVTPENEIRNSSSTYDTRDDDDDQRADASYEADMEVAGINSLSSPNENPFFADRDTSKRCPPESARRKGHQRVKSRDEDYHLLAIRNASRDEEEKKFECLSRGTAPLAMTRKDSATSHSSASGVSDGHPGGRGGKILGSCEYCDSSASKDSGIHSEIDSASGASYSDASIGRRLRYSASAAGAHNSVGISTIREREIDRFEQIGSPDVQDFDIVPTSVKEQNGLSAILNTETSI